MILWTVQTLDAWNILQRDKILRANDQFSEPDFAPAYGWMVEQMRQRLAVQPTAALPLWAWYQYNGETRRKPDLRARGHLPPGQKGVRLEFEIADNQVLLSDFMLWHHVLNYWYLPTSLAEGDAFEAKVAAQGLSFYKTKPLPDLTLDAAIRHSWERIFDLEWAADDVADPKKKKAIQATFWELSLESVRQATEFTGR